MADKSQRGSKETRKAKQPKVKASPTASPFIVTPGNNQNGSKKG